MNEKNGGTHSMNHIYKDVRWALYNLGRDIITEGHEVAPRGIPTREILHPTITILDTSSCLSVDMGRKLNSNLAAIEALSIIGGFADERLFVAAAPRYLDFTGGALTGAYGPRLREQLPIITEMLRIDPDTRQAVAMIWNLESDLFKTHGDRPCTTEIRFLIRDKRLITNTLMRSQDVYLGFTYDMVMFCMLHQTMANALNVRAGHLVHQVQSLHAYERDIEAIKQIKQPIQTANTTLRGLDGVSWRAAAARARHIAYHDVETDDPTEAWLDRQMREIRAKAGTTVTDNVGT